MITALKRLYENHHSQDLAALKKVYEQHAEDAFRRPSLRSIQDGARCTSSWRGSGRKQRLRFKLRRTRGLLRPDRLLHSLTSRRRAREPRLCYKGGRTPPRGKTFSACATQLRYGLTLRSRS
jgi:hypothetical protein